MLFDVGLYNQGLKNLIGLSRAVARALGSSQLTYGRIYGIRDMHYLAQGSVTRQR